MLKRIGLAALVLTATLLVHGTAMASPFDGWTVEQVTKHPDFVRSTESMSSALNRSGGRRVYHWIGYIPVDDTRVYFTSFGEPLTCVQWEATGEWVPEWAYNALDSLEREGYIRINGEPAPEGDAEEPITVEGRG